MVAPQCGQRIVTGNCLRTMGWGSPTGCWITVNVWVPGAPYPGYKRVTSRKFIVVTCTLAMKQLT